MEFVLEELSTAVNYGGKLHGQRTESRDCGGVESDEQQPSCESAVRDARPLTSRVILTTRNRMADLTDSTKAFDLL